MFEHLAYLYKCVCASQVIPCIDAKRRKLYYFDVVEYGDIFTDEEGWGALWRCAIKSSALIFVFMSLEIRSAQKARYARCYACFGNRQQRQYGK